MFQNMRRICGRSDGRDGPDGGKGGLRAQDRGTPQRVTDDQGRRAVLTLEPPSRRNQIIDTRREVGIREIALALAEPGEVEAENRESGIRELAGERDRRAEVLRAGETVGEERCRAGTRTGRKVESGGQPVTQGTGKGYAIRWQGAGFRGRKKVSMVQLEKPLFALRCSLPKERGPPPFTAIAL